jgi:hypothetical protein
MRQAIAAGSDLLRDRATSSRPAPLKNGVSDAFDSRAVIGEQAFHGAPHEMIELAAALRVVECTGRIGRNFPALAYVPRTCA